MTRSATNSGQVATPSRPHPPVLRRRASWLGVILLIVLVHGPRLSAAPVTTTDDKDLLKGAGAVDENAPQEFSTTESGLRYRILRKSDGPKPKANNTVTVNYRGWLDNGKEFDSSYARGKPISFPLNRVIPGWTEGMQLVGKGGMIELWIPAKLGYGARGAGSAVPPNATLHFLVELLEMK